MFLKLSKIFLILFSYQGFFPMLIIINSLIMRVDDKAHCNYGIINAKLDCVVSCKGLYLPFSNFPLATINAIHAI